jgi:hypothetical protein
MTLIPVARISDEVDWSRRRARPVDRGAVRRLHGAGFVDRLADDVHDAAERAGADRHRDRRAGVGDRLTADQAVGGVHGDGAHGVLAEVLGHFEHQPVLTPGGVGVGGLERVQDLRQVALELHVDHGADDLGDAAGGLSRDGLLNGHERSQFRTQRAWPPLTVMVAFRPWGTSK